MLCIAFHFFFGFFIQPIGALPNEQPFCILELVWMDSLSSLPGGFILHNKQDVSQLARLIVRGKFIDEIKDRKVISLLIQIHFTWFQLEERSLKINLKMKRLFPACHKPFHQLPPNGYWFHSHCWYGLYDDWQLNLYIDINHQVHCTLIVDFLRKRVDRIEQAVFPNNETVLVDRST